MSDLKFKVVPVTAFEQNCSIVICEDTESVAIVDPGGDLDRIKKEIDRIGFKVEAIYLTHGHIDHAGGADELREELGVKVIGPGIDDKFLMDGLVDQARMYGLQGVRNVTPDEWLKDGDTFKVGNKEFVVIHTPGHAPGHMIFVHHDMKLIIGGDLLFSGSIGRSDLPGGDFKILMQSIKQKLLPIGDDYTVLPGHGPAVQIGVERLNNPFLISDHPG